MRIFKSIVLLVFLFNSKVSYAKKWYVNDAATTNDVYCTAIGTQVTQAVNIISGSNISGPLSAVNFAKFVVGDYLSGPGIPNGTYIVAKNAVTLKLEFSANATTTQNSTLTIYGGKTTNPVLSLKALINSGNVQDNDTIYVDAGTYNDKGITFKKNCVVIGAGAAWTIFDGGSNANNMNTLFVDIGGTGNANKIQLIGLKIQNSTYEPSIEVNAANTLDSTYLTIKDCFFENNWNSNTDGGAIFIQNQPYTLGILPAVLTVINTDFLNNHTTYGRVGGSIAFTSYKGRLNISNSRFHGCNDKNLSVIENTDDGGALYISGATKAEVFNCVFRDFVVDYGGAIQTDACENLWVYNSVFYNNTAEDGSAIHTSNGKTWIYNSLFVANNSDALSERGGVIFTSYGGTINIYNSTIANNKNSSSGIGGIHAFQGKINTYNSIVWGNKKYDAYGYLGEHLIENSILGVSGKNNVWKPKLITVSVLNTDPLFINPISNDFRIQATSPAIDLGTSSVLTTDIVGYSRTVVPDAGAFEFGSSAITIPSLCGIFVVPPSAPTVSVTVQPTCTLSTGTVAVSSPAEGTGYEYSIDGGTYQSSATFTGVSSGSHTVKVRKTADITQVSDVSTVTVDAVPSPPTAGITNNTGVTQIDCTNPSISLTATGGVSYSWSDGASTVSVLAGLSVSVAGAYTVTVTAANGCTDTEVLTLTKDISVPTAGITNNTGVTQIDCTNPSISLTATGGATYAWSDGASTVSVLAGLSVSVAGAYTVTVTTSNGCTDTETITVTKVASTPTAGITNNTVVTQIDCTNPSISLTATGGVSYSWSDGVSTTPGVNLLVNAAGTYTVTATATNGCTDTEVLVITKDITPPTAGITNNTGVNQIDCTNPSISLTATGGASYSWSDGVTTTLGANLLVNAAGSYTVTATAANGCTDTEVLALTKDISVPTAGITNNTGVTQIDCTNPSISMTATGGATYSWSDGVTTTLGANLLVNVAGTYTVTATAANGCTDTEVLAITKDISVPTAGITNNTGVTQIDCTNPSISLTATGGVSYSWSDGVTTTPGANLLVNNAGTYTVTATAANGCTDTEMLAITKDISVPIAGITNNTGVTQIDCTNPSISLTSTGGASYSWSDGATTTLGANLLVNAAGTYTVTATAANGCMDTEFLVLTKDISILTAGITNNTGVTQIDCTNPSISLTATGGVSYSWSDGVTTTPGASLLVNAAGSYTVTATAANGCTDTEVLVLTKDISVPTAGITNNTGVIQIDCTNPSISLTATGGVSYSWSDGVSTTPGANLLVNAAGTYTVTATATNGCMDTEFLVLTKDISILTAGITNNTGVTQIDCTNPSISLTATGGISYSWSDGVTTTPGASLLVNAAGTYTVTATAANGCTDTEVLVITKDITPPTAGITNNTGVNQIDCTNPSISLTATGGVSYSWSDGVSTTLGANLLVNNAGTYTVTATAANGCTDTEVLVLTKDISVPTSGITNNTGVTQIDCTNPSISLTATGGVSYSWSDGVTTTPGANLLVNAAGTYTVTATAANGCTDTEVLTLTKDISAPTAGITNNTGVTQIDCTNPSISLTATGGVSYSWSDGVTTTLGANLLVNNAGTYTVTATAANGCTDTEVLVLTKDISVPTAGITNNTGVTQIDCTNPSISLTATGGVSYSWSDGVSTTLGANLLVNAAGTYTVTATAANGCTDTEVLVLTKDISVPIAGITNNTGVTQIDCTNPSISLTATGGASYSWSDGVTTTLGANLLVNSAGSYTVTATAANGCIDTEVLVLTKDISVPIAGITNNTGVTQINCTNPSISLTATGGVSYSWSDGVSTTPGVNLIVNAAGTYTVTATAANGCTDTEVLTLTKDISVPLAGITNNTGVTQIDCTNPSISLTATGGASYSWSDGVTTTLGANLLVNSAGIYTVTATAANGCKDTEVLTITKDISVPTVGITNNTGVTQIDCINTAISLTATGGASYSWSDGVTTTLGANLLVNAAGTYTVTATAANGCTDTEVLVLTKDISVPTAGITNNTGVTQIDCTNPSISLTATGGVSYSWSDGVSTTPGVNLIVNAAGTYTVTATAANGCTDTEVLVITKDISAPTAGITNNTGVTQIDCTNPSISLTATGGASYSWSDGVTTTPGASLLVNAAGSYTVTTTAANGCTDTEVLAIIIDISVPTAGITSTTGVSQIDCTNPSISLIATGGVSYSWSDGVTTTPGASLLVNAAGSYTVTTTAANGCTDTEVLAIIIDISVPTAGITNTTGVSQIDCTNPSISLTATGGASYSWSDGVTTTLGANLLVNAAGTYTVTATAANGCTDTEVLVLTKDISVTTAGITNNTGVTQIDCTNPSISLTATGGATYSWSDGVTTTLGANLLVNAAGSYTVTATAANGCTDTEAISISIILKPVTPTLNSVNHPTCVSNGTVTVTNFDNSLTYGFNPSTGISIDPLIGIISASSGTYKFAVNNSGCTSDSVSVIFNAVPGKPVLTGVTTICSGTSVQLDAWGDTTKTVASIPNGLTPWASADNTIATVVNGLVSGLTDGTVTITYKDINNCTQTALIQVGILVGGGTATATTSSLCANTSTTINLIGNTGTVQWQSSTDGATNWTNISSATTSTYSTALLNAGSYYYRALVTSGVCAATATSNVVTITVSPSPSEGTVIVTPDTLCVGGTALLKLVGPVGNIQWQESVNGTSGWINITGATGATSNTCSTGTLNTTTYYKAILSSGACLDVESAIFKVVVNPYVAASVSIASDQTETAGEITICPDSKVVFTATPSLGLGTVVYQWKNKGLNINSANKSTYVSSSLKDGDIITCELTTVGGKCITGSPTTSNPIKVNVLVNDLSLIGSSPTSCNLLDGFIQVKGTGAGTVKWAFASTPLVVLGTYPGVTLTKVAPFETIPNLAKGNYRVTFNNGTCDFSKDVTLTDPSVPQDALLTVSTTLPICQGQLITITANVLDPSILAPTTKYHWKKDGLDFNGFQPQLGNSITVGVAGTYSVVLEDGTCTSNANDTILNVTASPVDLNISNLAPKFCKSAGKQVSDLTLLASNLTQTITWYDAPVNGFAFKDADLLLTGSYYAEQSEGACKSINRTKVDVTVIDLAAPSIPGNNTQPSCLVATGSVELNMPSAGVWDITATPVVGNPVKVNTNNLTTNPFTYSFTGLDPGSYTFQIKDKNGCVSPNSTTVIIDQQPVSPATPILDATEIYCASKSYTVDQIKFSPAPTGTVKYYDANDLAISGQTVVVANTVYKFSFDNGKCESKVKLATTIPFDKGPTLIPLVDLTTSLICAIDKPTFNTIIAKSPLTIPSGYTLLISSDATGNPLVPNTTQIGSLGGATQTVYYNIINDKGCQSTSFAKLQFKINEGPTDLVLTSAKTYCATDKPTIASLNDAQISGTGVLKWYVSETSITPLSGGTTLTSGTYFASTTLTPGCESVVRKSVDVTIESFGQTILDPANAYAFCKGSIKTIVDLSTKPYFSNEIVWLNANKVVQTPGTVLIPGTYFATLTKNGCISPNTQEIDVTITSPIISITPSKLPTCGAGSGILVLTGADASYTYQWTKNGQVMTEKGAQITNLIDDLSIKYAVIVTDTKGCTAKDTAMFSGCAPGNIPQIITPDGNGKNDAWIIKYSDLYPEVTVLIFNRWGALVYKSEKPYKDDWDGKSNLGTSIGSDILPTGTYFYQIDKGNGDALESGYLELVK